MDSSAILVFDFESQKVRVISIDGEPWFVAKDLCDVLEISNSRDALTRLDKDEKQELPYSMVVALTDDLNTTRLSAISESGMYTLVLTSRKAEAKPFRKWVTSEVLPSIRKTGSYTQPNLIEEPKPLILPPVDVRVSNLANALSFLGVDATNPRWSSGIKDLVIDILGVTQPLLPANEEKWKGVVEVAFDLGFNHAHKLEIRSSLGKYISKQAKKLNLDRRQEERLCNGTIRLIWLYKETSELQNLITTYFTKA